MSRALSLYLSGRPSRPNPRGRDPRAERKVAEVLRTVPVTFLRDGYHGHIVFMLTGPSMIVVAVDGDAADPMPGLRAMAGRWEVLITASEAEGTGPDGDAQPVLMAAVERRGEPGAEMHTWPIEWAGDAPGLGSETTQPAPPNASWLLLGRPPVVN